MKPPEVDTNDLVFAPPFSPKSDHQDRPYTRDAGNRKLL